MARWKRGQRERSGKAGAHARRCSPATGRSPGVPDEMVDADGSARPVWKPLIAALDELGPEELDRRFARADQYLRDAGVYYRVYDKAGARRARLAAGPCAAADRRERMAGDHRRPGPARRTARGGRRRHLRRQPAGRRGPAAARADRLAARNSCGRWSASSRPSGHFLHFCAFELGRGPDGGWWVLGDRTQAPSGAGFALENRVATTRALSDIYGEMHVHRLAGFFRRFRDALHGMVDAPDGPRRHPDARPAQRNLFRARLHRPLSRHHAARGRGPHGLGRQADGAHRLRPEAGQRAVAPHGRRLRRSARAQPAIADRHARPGRGAAPRRGVDGQRARLRHPRNARLPRLPAASFAAQLRGEELLLPNIATWWCGQARGAPSTSSTISTA